MAVLLLNVLTPGLYFYWDDDGAPISSSRAVGAAMVRDGSDRTPVHDMQID